ncbi:folate-binding protein YgfZ [Chitinivorax sp. B]|uniref:CAF17-like 4Fe-4S cluster assembly/insertion protein YgfZ n=1 Tax=Chitinivorax sp. B TaxID=2502235 RepID=UPI0010F7982A|nr:folate-binding protein YgfZ [Chitinivorax sp. B]
MNPNWQAFLTAHGAHFDNQQVAHFGQTDIELAAASHGTILADLSAFGVIGFHGEETVTFLNNLLSSDVRKLDITHVQWSSFSTPKGRMLASFLIWRDNENYLLQLPRELREGMQKKLSMYILRTKTRAENLSNELVLLGLAGPQAAALLTTHLGEVPADTMHSIHHHGVTVIRLGIDRFQLAMQAELAPTLWEKLAAEATPVGQSGWSLREVQAGTPWITPATQEQFVAQMANMELIGAVSFNKGCYPGQEIVARTQYLGKLKRRMYLVHIDQPDVKAGSELYSPEMEGQAIGMIVNAAPVPNRGVDALAVIQMSSLPHGIHLGSPEGPLLTIKTLPYSVS